MRKLSLLKDSWVKSGLLLEGDRVRIFNNTGGKKINAEKQFKGGGPIVNAYFLEMGRRPHPWGGELSRWESP